MSQQRRAVWGWVLLLTQLCLCVSIATAQQPPAVTAPPATNAPQAQAAPPQVAPKAQLAAPQVASQLFNLVDELIKFSSDETGLPIKNQVKRQITSRAEVESFLNKKMEEDESAKRLQRSEIVLKKFGLLDRDFVLKPFLLSMLKEQIEAYYDPKTKTVYMLDWVGINEQKPVLAHELTHALQDQHSNLEKWNNQTPDDVSLNASGDTDHLAKDEMDTARTAVVEGQATAVMMDYLLKPRGLSLVKNPEILDVIKQRMNGGESSPVMARAPLLLSESLLFPYREGLSFEQDVWMDQGQTAAFAGTLDRPPTSSWEILNPREYEKQHAPALLRMPDIHPLVDKLYTPYDIGQIGQLDLHILTELFGGEQAARDLTPAWNGGLYWAGQQRSAKTATDHPTDKDPSAGTPADQAGTSSIALFYLSAWKSAASAQAFAQLYARELARKYSGVKSSRPVRYAVFPPSASPSMNTDDSASDPDASDPTTLPGEKLFSTSEGTVLITTRGNLVFVAESFDLDLARKLTALVLDAQATGEIHAAKTIAATHDSATGEPLTANLIRFFSNCGVMKSAVSAAMQAAR